MSKQSLDQVAKPHGLEIDHPSEHKEHIVGPGIYVGIFLFLVVMTIATTAIAYVNLGIFNAVVALVIATMKALGVILFFMHVKYSAKTTTLTVVSAAFFLCLLLGLSMSDYISRSWSAW